MNGSANNLLTQSFDVNRASSIGTKLSSPQATNTKNGTADVSFRYEQPTMAQQRKSIERYSNAPFPSYI